MKRFIFFAVILTVIVCLLGCQHPGFTPTQPGDGDENPPDSSEVKGEFSYTLAPDSLGVLIIIENKEQNDIGSKLVEPADSDSITDIGFCSDVYGWEPDSSSCRTSYSGLPCTLYVQPNLDKLVYGAPFAVLKDSLSFSWFNLSEWEGGVIPAGEGYIISVHADSL